MLGADRPPVAALYDRTTTASRAIAARLVAVRPVVLLLPLALVQTLIGVWFAFSTPHNGWVWYSGGDATEYWTSEWALAHRVIPQALVGDVLPALYSWVPLLKGDAFYQGAAVIVPLQALILVPLALVCFWGVANRLFGRLFAWWATVIWVLGPFLLVLGFTERYHAPFEQYFLAPHWFGLTNMADLPSLVAVLACAWTTLRAVDTRHVPDALLAGLLGGLMLGLKPANGFFLVALAVLFLATRSWRVAAFWTAALLPAVLTLALWKLRGLGTLPIVAAEGSLRLAAGAGSPVPSVGFIDFGKYTNFSGHHLHEELLDLREVFWSLRLLEFIAFAGILAALRRSWAKGAFLAVWFAAFMIVKGSSANAGIPSANYFRLAEPGLPAFILLAASLVYLVPGAVRRTARTAPVATRPVRTRWVAAVAVVFALVPLVVVGIASPASSPPLVRSNTLANNAPLTDELDVRAARGPGGALVSWRAPDTGRTKVVYEVFRSRGSDGCALPDKGSKECILEMDLAGTTGNTTFTDRESAGHWFYRVAVAASYRRTDTTGDLMLVSPAVSVDLG